VNSQEKSFHEPYAVHVFIHRKLEKGREKRLGNYLFFACINGMKYHRRKFIKKSGIAIGGAFIFNKSLLNTLKNPMKLQPFKVDVPDNQIDDLKFRIRRSRWPDQITGAGWSSGTDLAYLSELATYWSESYSWRKTEKEINSYPNFLAQVNGLDIHFLHIKGNGKKSVPLIITHGWPGSFLEMMKLIPLLTSDTEFSFDLVIPSIIGFGFSGKDTQPGCNSAFVADLWHQLMQGLGYSRYGVQGGDIGAGVSSRMAMQYPESVIGVHLNFISGSYAPYDADQLLKSPEMIAYKKRVDDWSAVEGAYSTLQSSKPQTLAYGLNDSPIGLCAWIVEKFNSWSDNKGDLEKVISKDELLGNVSLYWFTQSLPSSIRIYQENSIKPLHFGKNDYIRNPVAFASFPKELPTPPRSYIEKGYNIRQWTDMPAGGHFAAMEQPELLSADITKFFQKIYN
jgi:pimeloyl-ACP methyl ester carboxylesterase